MCSNYIPHLKQVKFNLTSATFTNVFKKELEDNLVSLNKKYEKTLKLLDDTLVIPDKKELNAMTKKTIEEVATGLGLEVNVKETKANMIKSFDKQAKKMVKELEASGSVESTTESEWIEATYIKE